jgi:hypothetical protein
LIKIINSPKILNLDGSVNIEKTKMADKEGRTLPK